MNNLNSIKMTLSKNGLILLAFLFISNLIIAQRPLIETNELSDGWVSLFDGVSSSGWKKADGEDFPVQGWSIKKGVISVNPTKGRGGDIVTIKEFSNFELAFEFKLTKGANSGVKYFILENSSLGFEYQILDDENHPDAKLGKNGNRLLGSLYDLVPANKDKIVNPIGEWNRGKIIVQDNHIEHWLNGEKILEFKRNSRKLKKIIDESKYKDIEEFGSPEKSPILLQDHGDEVFFRNIKIKELK